MSIINDMILNKINNSFYICILRGRYRNPKTHSTTPACAATSGSKVDRNVKKQKNMNEWMNEHWHTPASATVNSQNVILAEKKQKKNRIVPLFQSRTFTTRLLFPVPGNGWRRATALSPALINDGCQTAVNRSRSHSHSFPLCLCVNFSVVCSYCYFSLFLSEFPVCHFPFYRSGVHLASHHPSHPRSRLCNCCTVFVKLPLVWHFAGATCLVDKVCFFPLNFVPTTPLPSNLSDTHAHVLSAPMV